MFCYHFKMLMSSIPANENNFFVTLQVLYYSRHVKHRYHLIHRVCSVCYCIHLLFKILFTPTVNYNEVVSVEIFPELSSSITYVHFYIVPHIGSPKIQCYWILRWFRVKSDDIFGYITCKNNTSVSHIIILLLDVKNTRYVAIIFWSI